MAFFKKRAGARPAAGGCGGKDQVSRIGFYIFFGLNLKLP